MMVEHLMERPEVKVLLELLRISNEGAYRHSYRTAELTEKILSRTAGWTRQERENILLGALLHDIGKAFVPFNLTQVCSPLSTNEKSIVQLHAALSYEIVKPVFPRIVQDVCLWHHERLNGTGYPNGKTMATLPEYVLIVQVADVYDALTSYRAYKESYPKDEALSIMERETKEHKMDDYYLKILREIVDEEEAARKQAMDREEEKA